MWPEAGDTAGNVPEVVSPGLAPPSQGSLPRLLPYGGAGRGRGGGEADPGCGEAPEQMPQ